jgi:hypothetical protein
MEKNINRYSIINSIQLTKLNEYRLSLTKNYYCSPWQMIYLYFINNILYMLFIYILFVINPLI